MPDYYQLAVQEGRFEGTEREHGKAARASEMQKFMQGQGGGAGGAGGSAYDQLLQDAPSSLDFAKSVQQPIDAVTQKMIEAMQNRAKPLDMFNQLETAAGLPQQRKAAQSLREQVFSLEDSIKRVKPTVAATTRESMVTQGQRERMIQQQSQPMIENLGTVATSLGRLEGAISKAEATLAQKLGLFMQGQEMDLEPFRIQLDSMQQSAARLQTGFSDDKQTFLEITLGKIRRGEQIEDRDRAEAFDLLKIEKEYNNQLGLMREQSEINMAEFLKQAGVNQKNALEQLRVGSGLNRDEARFQAGLDVETAEKLMPLTLEEYEKKLQLDRKYPAPKSGSGTPNLFEGLGGLGLGSDWSIVPAGAGAPSTQGLSKPPMSANPGTVSDYGGVSWIMMSDGNWRQIAQ